jgi:hypothetical protein
MFLKQCLLKLLLILSSLAIAGCGSDQPPDWNGVETDALPQGEPNR